MNEKEAMVSAHALIEDVWGRWPEDEWFVLSKEWDANLYMTTADINAGKNIPRATVCPCLPDGTVDNNKAIHLDLGDGTIPELTRGDRFELMGEVATVVGGNHLAYKIVHPNSETTYFVRNAHNPTLMFVTSQDLKQTSFNGYEWFTDELGVGTVRPTIQLLGGV